MTIYIVNSEDNLVDCHRFIADMFTTREKAENYLLTKWRLARSLKEKYKSRLKLDEEGRLCEVVITIRACYSSYLTYWIEPREIE